MTTSAPSHAHAPVDAGATEQDGPSSAMSRRRLLQAGAAGGAVAGAAWLAPSMLTLDRAAAAGTCPGSSLTFSWATNGGANLTRHTASAAPLAGNTGGPTGVDVRVVSTAVSANGVANAGLIQDNWSTRSAAAGSLDCGSAATTNFPRGNSQSFYSLLMNNTAANNCNSNGTAGRFVEVELGFYVPGSTTTRYNVRNLTFSLYDIDSSETYRDQVTLWINGSTTPVTLGAANQATATRASGDPASTITAPGASAVIQAKSDSSAAANSTAGNIQIAFNNGVNVNRIRIRFTDILGSAPSTVQWVGIGNLSFCKFGVAA